MEVTNYVKKKTPRFVKADGSFDKQAYNKWYYENHKDMYKQDSPRTRANKYGPNPVAGYSPEQFSAQKLDNEKYYRDAMGKNKWTVSPKKGLGYTDVGAYIDNNIEYTKHNQDVNHKYKMRLAKEAGASSTDLTKMDAAYKRAQAYADNERAKQLRSYEQIKQTYTKDFDKKLKNRKYRDKIKNLFKSYQDAYNIGMDTIIDSMSAGAKAVDRFVSNIFK